MVYDNRSVPSVAVAVTIPGLATGKNQKRGQRDARYRDLLSVRLGKPVRSRATCTDLLPRTDLQVTVEGVLLKPAWRWAADRLQAGGTGSGGGTGTLC